MTRDPLDWPTRAPLAHRRAVTPDRTAAVDAATGREWSYRALGRWVDATAASLLSRLDSRGSTATAPRVGLLVSTRVGSVTAVHATLRIGAELAPMNVRLSERKRREQVDLVDPDLVVCEQRTETPAAEAAGAVGCPVVSLDAPASADVGRLPVADGETRDSIEPARWARDDTAVVLFTSGTTGEPDCVRLTAGNLAASATASAFRVGVAPGDRWLDCLPVYHMGGLAPLLRCPLYGTALIVQNGFDAGRTAETVATRGATGVSLVPTQLRRLLDNGWSQPASLDTVLLGGAPATATLVERALDAGVPVYPTYGLTEAASQVATATPSLARDNPASVGQPLVFADVTVVDSSGTPVEAGERGEIVIDGPTVTPGYLDSEAAFGEHGLHTRDVGYRDADGRLWVLGRTDDTIVTGGENVHPAEVESVLCEHPGVAEAAVVGLPGEEWGERVGALVVAPGVSAPGDLRAFARDRLAGFKLPRTLEFAETLPRTPSGTVDRETVRESLPQTGSGG